MTEQTYDPKKTIKDVHCGTSVQLVRQSFQATLYDVQETFSFVLHVMLTAHFDIYSKHIPITFFALDERYMVRIEEDEQRTCP